MPKTIESEYLNAITQALKLPDVTWLESEEKEIVSNPLSTQLVFDVKESIAILGISADKIQEDKSVLSLNKTFVAELLTKHKANCLPFLVNHYLKYIAKNPDHFRELIVTQHSCLDNPLLTFQANSGPVRYGWCDPAEDISGLPSLQFHPYEPLLPTSEYSSRTQGRKCKEELHTCEVAGISITFEHRDERYRPEFTRRPEWVPCLQYFHFARDCIRIPSQEKLAELACVRAYNQRQERIFRQVTTSVLFANVQGVVLEYLREDPFSMTKEQEALLRPKAGQDKGVITIREAGKLLQIESPKLREEAEKIIPPNP